MGRGSGVCLMSSYDVAIIGAGVAGCAVARSLSKYKLKTVVIEAEDDVACGTTKANTAIVHAGYDAKPGTMKAMTNLMGSRMYEGLCRELDVPYHRTGTLVVAIDPLQGQSVLDLKARGDSNGVPGLEVIDGKRLLDMEPNVNPEAHSALYAPTGAYTCPWEMATALMENAVENGVDLLLGEEVMDISERDGDFELVLRDRVIKADYVINAAGLKADAVASMIGKPDFRIAPRRGEYWLLDKNLAGMVTRPLFTAPTPISKGVVVTPTADGNLMAGPNAENIEDPEDTSTTQEGLEKVWKDALSLVPRLPRRSAITNFAGLRAAAYPQADFIVGPMEGHARFFNVAGIESPGLTSAPAIAQMITGMLEKAGLKLEERPGWKAERRGIVHFALLSREEQDELVRKDHRYGHVVCRCETVTEAEIIAALNRPVPVRTMDGLKRRTRQGAGRCQAGFCSPRVLGIVARELGVTIEQISKNGDGSFYVTGLLGAGEEGGLRD